jgi:hypothetical protein
VAAFVERATTLDHAPSAATRKDDRAALAAMAETGVTKAVLRELERTAKVALSTEHSTVVPDAMVHLVEPEDERLENLRRIHAWYSVWSDIARRVITNKRHLVLLGVRHPRRKAKVIVTPQVVPVTSIAPEDRSPDSRAA